MLIFGHLEAFFNFFFKNMFLLQNGQEIIKKHFWKLSFHLKTSCMPFWTIYDNLKISIFSNFFAQKSNFFFFEGHFGNFAVFF